MIRFGFIGCGNMGGALAKAVCKAVPASSVAMCNRTRKKADDLAGELGALATDGTRIAQEAHFIMLGVKPQMMKEALAGIASELKARKDEFVLVSMAAGLSQQTIRDMAGVDAPVIRISPNTPVAIGEGIVLVSYSDNVKDSDKKEFLDALGCCGLVTEISENLHAVGGTLSGCGPAFTDMYIEALADGAVACGMPRKQALEIAAQMVVGSGKLLLDTGRHPGELKDAVCSPGGTTIQGVRTLEEKGFRGAAMDAVIAAYEKNLKL